MSSNKAKCAKKAYAQPALVAYGSVSSLTMAMTVGAFADAMAMTMIMP